MVSSREDLERRVVRVAAATLERNDEVAAIDVLVGLGWLAPSHVDTWRQGRVPDLETQMQVRHDRVADALAILQRWVDEQGLQPSEATYVARTPDRRPLRFSADGDAATDQAYRTHWQSPMLSPARRAKLSERANREPDLVVISPLGEWTCASCGGTGGFLIMQDQGPTCLSCAGLPDLVFLPRGDTGLTRRAKRASSVSAVVVRFSRARKRYERQGILVEESALAQAEAAPG